MIVFKEEKEVKKFLGIIFIFILIVGLAGCKAENKEVSDSLKFKEEYEGLNGTTNSSGKVHRTVSIDDDNPFVYASDDDIVSKIENEETFYVYFGSKLCPWCRSVIEEAIKVLKENNIKTIYYVDIWDDDGNEIMRDKYILENGEVILDSEGTSSYYKLLDLLDDVLDDYSLTDDDGKIINVDEKRIYAPTFIYVEDGKAVRITDGVSDKQTDSRAELTSEILEDEDNLFNEFFQK